MTSLSFSMDKLKKLTALAMEAKDGYEKAAIFAAIEALVNNLLNDKLLPKHLTEKVISLKFHLSILLGYEHSNGFDLSNHALMVVNISEELENNIRLYSKQL